MRLILNTVLIAWLAYIIATHKTYEYKVIDKIINQNQVTLEENRIINRYWKVDYHIDNSLKNYWITRYYTDYHIAFTFEPVLPPNSESTTWLINLFLFMIYLVPVFIYNIYLIAL